MRKNSPTQWTAVDRYFGDLFAAHDEPLQAAVKANRAARLPAIDVSPLQGKFLNVLVQMTQAKRVLEIGTLGGYSTIWMARALPKRPHHFAGIQSKTRRGRPRQSALCRAAPACRDPRWPRLESLPQLKAEGAGPFGLIFIDADKETIRSILNGRSSSPPRHRDCRR